MTTPELGRFQGKRVAVFGGTSGLGLHLAERFHQEGADVTVISRRAQDVQFTLPARRLTADVTDPRSLARAFQAMDKQGDLDIVVNAVGQGLRRRASQTSPTESSQIIATNLQGVINTSWHAAKRMEKRGQGIIVNIGSTSGLKARANESSYVAAKWGVTGYTRSLRMELNPEGIAVVLANPGGMDTPFWDKADRTQDTSGFMEPGSVADKIVDYIAQPNLLQTDQEIVIERPKK